MIQNTETSSKHTKAQTSITQKEEKFGRHTCLAIIMINANQINELNMDFSTIQTIGTVAENVTSTVPLP